MRRGDPGYGSHLDRDGDGVGCERNIGELQDQLLAAEQAAAAIPGCLRCEIVRALEEKTSTTTAIAIGHGEPRTHAGDRRRPGHRWPNCDSPPAATTCRHGTEAGIGNQV